MPVSSEPMRLWGGLSADLVGRRFRSGLAQCPERRPHLLREQLWLFPGGEVAAPFGLVEVDQVVVALFTQWRGTWNSSPGNTV